MKKLLLIAIMLVFWCSSYAQNKNEKVNFKVPTPSPEATFTQQFGDSEIKVAYGRPQVKGRKVFGGLVPFDSLWRTGAGDCTSIELKEEVIIGDKKMAPGKYALFTIPRANEWVIILNTDVSLHGSFGYDQKKDAHRFSVKPLKTDRFYETFTIEINDFKANGAAALNLFWENTWVKIPLGNPLDETILTEITQRLIKNQEQNADLLFQSANYYYATRRDLSQAVKWALAAEKLDPENFSIPNLTQKIYAELQEYPLAIQAAKRALVLGEKQNRTSAVLALKKSIAEWEAKK
jgi:hypothetical protein